MTELSFYLRMALILGASSEIKKYENVDIITFKYRTMLTIAAIIT